MSKYDAKKQLKCSFCGKPQDQVRRLVAGPSVYICDECIELCQDKRRVLQCPGRGWHPQAGKISLAEAERNRKNFV